MNVWFDNITDNFAAKETELCVRSGSLVRDLARLVYRAATMIAKPKLSPDNAASGTYGPAAVHVANFSATPLGPITALTLFALASPGLQRPLGVLPVFTAALTPENVKELRDVLNQVIMASETMKADAAKPQ